MWTFPNLLTIAQDSKWGPSGTDSQSQDCAAQDRLLEWSLQHGYACWALSQTTGKAGSLASPNQYALREDGQREDTPGGNSPCFFRELLAVPPELPSRLQGALPGLYSLSDQLELNFGQGSCQTGMQVARCPGILREPSGEL